MIRAQSGAWFKILVGMVKSGQKFCTRTLRVQAENAPPFQQILDLPLLQYILVTTHACVELYMSYY